MEQMPLELDGESALVVLSGGQDSTTCLYWSLQNYKEVHAITFDYGQRHFIEIDAAIRIAEMAGIKERHSVVHVPDILHSSSPLVSNSPLEKYNNAEAMNKTIGLRRELTFVPMRNALFLTLAANRAEAAGIKTIVTGICAMDGANYDDCRPEFLKDADAYINSALGHDHRNTGRIRIEAPLMYLSKAETVIMAKSMPPCWEALAYTHTSYDGKFPPIDNNHANVLRADGFEKAGLPDPLVLRAVKEQAMELPTSSNYRGLA